jgi:hypothetical protein
MDFFHRPIKTKAKSLKLQRFESGFCFRLQVNNNNKGGLMGKKHNHPSTPPLIFIIYLMTKAEPAVETQ